MPRGTVVHSSTWSLGATTTKNGLGLNATGHGKTDRHRCLVKRMVAPTKFLQINPLKCNKRMRFDLIPASQKLMDRAFEKASIQQKHERLEGYRVRRPSAMRTAEVIVSS